MADKRFNVPMLPCGSEEPPCCPVQLMVGCGHSDRGYMLKVPGTPTRNGKYVLQMLADTAEPGSLSDMLRLREMIRVDLSTSACKRGYVTARGLGSWALLNSDTSASVRPAVEVVGPGVGTCSAAPYAVNAYPHDLPFPIDLIDPVIGVVDFLEYFLSPYHAPQTYGVAVQCCDGTDHFVADVEIFPAQEWSGELSFGYKPTEETSYEAFKNPGRRDRGHVRTIHTRAFEASCSISAKYLNRTIGVEFPLDFTDALKSVTETVEKVTDISKKARQAANAKTGVMFKWEVKYPALKLNGTVKRAEKKGDWMVGYKGEVVLAAKPIIGVSGELDLIEALIKACATNPYTIAVAEVVRRVRKSLDDGGIAEVSLKLSGDASIGGELSWKGEYCLAPNGGKLGGELAFKLEGLVAAANDYWNVACGAVMGGESKFNIDIGFGTDKVEDNSPDPPSVKPKFSWSGIEVYWSMFVQRAKGVSYGARPPLRDRLEGLKPKDENRIQLFEKWSRPPETPFGQKPADEVESLASFFQ